MRNSVYWPSRGPIPGTSTGRLMIAVLGGLVHVERDLIRTRTAEGRSRAQKRGQHMGRPPKLTVVKSSYVYLSTAGRVSDLHALRSPCPWRSR